MRTVPLGIHLVDDAQRLSSAADTGLQVAVRWNEGLGVISYPLRRCSALQLTALRWPISTLYLALDSYEAGFSTCPSGFPPWLFHFS